MVTDTTSGQAETPDPFSPEHEVVDICRNLIRIDTSNFGDGRGPGERAAAEYAMGMFTDVGLDPFYVEPETGRGNVVVRIPGADSTRPGLVVHGHLDVVPADPADWRVDPFGGEIHEGCLWGRGAVDMKDMVAMMIANVRHMARTGQRPPRDVVVALFADEEAGGHTGAGWLVREHPELFEGCTEAISEVGGFSVTLPERDTGKPTRAYLVQCAEKGVLWLRLRAHGRAGHGSVNNDENAVARLSRAIARIDAHQWPRELIVPVRRMFEGASSITGLPFDPDDVTPLLRELGGARRFIEGTLSDTANPTMLDAGYKHNVIPQTATAAIDCRFLPGHEQELMDTLATLVGEHVEIEIVHRDVALEAEFEGALPKRMTAALQAEDPGAHVLPYCLSGGTDNKHLSILGIAGYGFAPLRLPADLDFVGMFHGVDERVPVDALRFGARVLQRLIADC